MAMMDADISRWILEFIIRETADQGLMNHLLSVLPVPNDDWKLNKAILLKKIELEILAGSVSENILDTLEVIVEMDKKNGLLVLESMKVAYCAVAVDCTLRYLEEETADLEGTRYFGTVNRIWRGKIVALESSENLGLISQQLSNWKNEIEAAISDNNVRKNVLTRDMRHEALNAVNDYVREAWILLGPAFLNVAAKSISREQVRGSSNSGRPLIQVNDVTIEPVQTSGSLPCANCQLGITDTSVARGEDRERPQGRLTVTHQGNSLNKSKHVAGPSGRRTGRARLAEVDEGDLGPSCSTCYSLSTPKVNKVQEALKLSLLELHAVVKDPLPDALRMAERIRSVQANKGSNEAARCNQDEIENVQGNEHTIGNSCSGHHVNVPKPSLMQRNNTARTYEWNDSIDASPESNRIHLPSPKRTAVSPLKNDELKKFARKRKNKFWSTEEEATLRTAVQRFGKGNWKRMLNEYRDIFEERTEVDLKDKWRNMTK